MILQKSPPSLARWRAALDNVLGNGGQGDLKPELEQFTIDAWRTPQRVLNAHTADQRSEV